MVGILKKLIPLVIIVITIACGGSSTPPAGIPAPVAGLISAVETDSSTLEISGSPGAVSGGAAVVVSTPTDSCSVTALSDGSFGAEGSCEAAGSAGDTVTIASTLDGSTTTTSITAPTGTTALSNPVVATTVHTGANQGFVASTDGTDSFIDVFALATLVNSSTFTISGFVLTDLAFDIGTGITYMIDNAAGELSILSTAGVVSSTVSLTSPLAVAGDDDDTFGLVGHESSTNSITLADNSGASVSEGATLLITHPTTGSTHTRSDAVSLDETAATVQLAAVLSVFANGDTVFSTVTVAVPPTNTLTLGSQVNLGSGTFTDVVLFSSATKAIVVDEDNDQAIILSGAGFATQTAVTVGDEPSSVAVDESANRAYIANKADNTVSVINLSSETVSDTLTTTDGVGLGPVDLSIDSSPAVLIIGNQTSQSGSLISVSSQ